MLFVDYRSPHAGALPLLYTAAKLNVIAARGRATVLTTVEDTLVKHSVRTLVAWTQVFFAIPWGCFAFFGRLL